MKTDRKKILIDIKVMYILAGLLLLICLVLDFYFNMKVRHYPSSTKIIDGQSFMLAVIQVQATVATLILTLISLISSSFKESYLGIRIIHYYLDISSKPFTFKTTIKVILMMIIASMALFMFHFYITILFLFVITIVFNIRYVDLIYKIVGDPEVIESDVGNYIIQVIENRSENEMFHFFISFCDDWLSVYNKQESESFERYEAYYEKCITRLYSIGSSDSIQLINSVGGKLLGYYLTANDSEIRDRGFQLLYQTYFVIAKQIKEVDKDNKKSRIHLLSDLIDIIENLPSLQDYAWFKDHTSEFFYLINMMIKIDSSRDISSEKAILKDNLYTIEELNGKLGDVLKKYEKPEKNINEEFWSNKLSYKLEDEMKTINSIKDEECKDFFERAIAESHFILSRGFLKNGYKEVVKNIQDDICGYLDNREYNLSTYGLLYILSESFHLYCLVYKPYDLKVDKELSANAKEVLDDSMKAILYDFSRYFLTKHLQFLDENAYKRFRHVFLRSGVLDQHDNLHRLRDIADEFYIYFVLYMRYVTEKDIDYSYVFKTNRRLFLEQIRNEDIIHKNLESFCDMVIDPASLEREANELYDDLKEGIIN